MRVILLCFGVVLLSIAPISEPSVGRAFSAMFLVGAFVIAALNVKLNVSSIYFHCQNPDVIFGMWRYLSLSVSHRKYLFLFLPHKPEIAHLRIRKLKAIIQQSATHPSAAVVRNVSVGQALVNHDF